MEALMSQLTGDGDSNNPVENEETSTLAESEAGESTQSDWTDEKHCLYIKYMEASFVNQLHNSLDLRTSCSSVDCSSEPRSSRHIHTGCHPYRQYKVLRDGCWANVNFAGDNIQLKKTNSSRVLLANPWIQHFRSKCRDKNATSVLRNQAAEGSVVNNTEVTDQNFVDDDPEQGHPTKADVDRDISSGTCCRKRMRTSEIATSSTDQVVPSGKFPTKEVVAENLISPISKGC